MNDPKIFNKENIENTAQKLLVRGYDLDVEQLQALQVENKELQTTLEHNQSERNRLSKEIAKQIKQGEDAQDLKNQVVEVNEQIGQLTQSLDSIKAKLQELYLDIPNIHLDDVPLGEGEDDNIEIKKWGEVPIFNFPIKDHTELGEKLGGISFTAGAKISGSRFVVLKSDIAKLNRALIALMLDQHSENGYQEINVPQLVKTECMIGTGQLPKFKEDQFNLEEEGFSLIPTAEVPLTNLLRDEIIAEDQLPIKYMAYSSCFRKEAGAYGKDTKGMIRLHQFEKVELVKFVKEGTGEAHLETLLNDAESILQRLKLPYRVVCLCTKDLGFTSHKTYDIEVWVPSQNKYREISSCSYFGTFQARRMMARYRANGSKKPQLLHTLNGSGLAVGRTLLAVLENYQQADGRIQIPEALQAYMGKEFIG